MAASGSGQLEIGGRRLTIRNLDRVVFPRAGTTKGELLDYYVRIGDEMLPHLRERQLHMHRYPEGVEGPRFWSELEDALDTGDPGRLVFEMGDVLARVDALGDLFEGSAGVP